MTECKNEVISVSWDYLIGHVWDQGKPLMTEDKAEIINVSWDYLKGYIWIKVSH